MPFQLSFQLLKVSLAHGVRSDGSIPWNHVTGPDLSVVLWGNQTTDENSAITMRIVQGNRVLDAIEISAYVDHAREVQNQAEQAGVQLQRDDLPIFAITKTSLLALRYRLEEKPRRIQLNMQDLTECQQVVNVLRQRGMDIVEPVPRSARPGTSGSFAGTMEIRPPSKNAGSGGRVIIQELPHSHCADGFSKLNAGSLDTYASYLQLSPAKERAQAGVSTNDLLSGRRLLRNEDVAPRYAEPARPTTSQMYRSHTMLLQPSQIDASSPSTIALDGKTRDPQQDQQMVIPNSTTGGLRGSIVRSGSRPISSALHLPPLPRPNPVQEPLSSSTLRPSSSSNSFVTPASRTAAPLKRHSEADQEISENRRQTPDRSKSSKEMIQKPRPMDELLRRRRQPLGEASRNRKMPRLNSLADAPHELVSPPATSAKVQACERPDEISLAGSLVHERLENYASQSLDDRHAALEDFMVANVDNPAFTKLCEDVENYWRRIVLHL